MKGVTVSEASKIGRLTLVTGEIEGRKTFRLHGPRGDIIPIRDLQTLVDFLARYHPWFFKGLSYAHVSDLQG